MTQSEPLLPCPFCDGIGCFNKDTRFGQDYWLARCGNSKCEVKPRTSEFFKKESAIKFWNTRAKSQPEVVPLDEEKVFEFYAGWTKTGNRNITDFLEKLCAKFAPVKPEGGMEWPEEEKLRPSEMMLSPVQMGWNACLEACKAKFTAPAPVKDWPKALTIHDPSWHADPAKQQGFIEGANWMRAAFFKVMKGPAPVKEPPQPLSGPAGIGVGKPVEVKEPEQSEVEELADFILEQIRPLKYKNQMEMQSDFHALQIKSKQISQAILNAGYRKGGGA